MKITFGIIATGYLAIGCLVHTVLIGTVFNPANVFAWACVFGWPVVLFVLLMLAGFVFGGLVLLCLWLSDVARAAMARLARS